MEYTAIIERCGQEGEKWITFVETETNIQALEKLRELVDKFLGKMEEDDSELSIIDREFTEQEVNLLIEINDKFVLGGYKDQFSKFDGQLNQTK